MLLHNRLVRQYQELAVILSNNRFNGESDWGNTRIVGRILNCENSEHSKPIVNVAFDLSD